MVRDKGCGEIRESDVGQDMLLFGWVFRRRDHGGLIFIDLRDRSGILQVVFSPDVSGTAHEHAHDLRSEYVIAVSGEIRKRPEGTENPSMATGMVEMYVNRLDVLNESSPLPFMVEDAADASESLRLQHRYLDEARDPEHQREPLAILDDDLAEGMATGVAGAQEVFLGEEPIEAFDGLGLGEDERLERGVGVGGRGSGADLVRFIPA